MLITRRAFSASAMAAATTTPNGVHHHVVYSEPTRYGGWPANHGIWHWGQEVVVGFTAHWYKPAKTGHAVDRDKVPDNWQARSRDGGITWTIEKPDVLRPPRLGGPEPTDCPGNLDFQNPNSAVMFRFSNANKGPSRFYYSQDRCHNWQGPFRVPEFGQKGIAARTDYLVEGKHQLLAFMAAAKSNGAEGRVFCARTKDGAKSWDFVSWIGPEPEGFSIMPSTVRFNDGRLLTVNRCRAKGKGWLEAWTSRDRGKSWSFLNRPADTGTGNPPSLVQLKDGRLCLTYGVRAEPFGIRARLSSDQGATWGNEIYLRTDGANGDLGYPRTVALDNGNVLAAYYFNGGRDLERTIEVTVWRP